MPITQAFIVLAADGDFDVYGLRQIPKGTVIGRDAQRFRVVGETWVQPPKTRLTASELEQWRRQLEAAGHTVTTGPFWTDPDMLQKSDEAIRRGETIPLKDFFDELRRRADGPGCREDRQLESVTPPPQ